MNYTNEYRTWLINELGLTDTEQMSTYDLEKRLMEALSKDTLEVT